MIKRISYPLGLLVLLSVSLVYAQAGPLNSRGLLFKSASDKNLVETARNHQWSVDFVKSGRDTIHIIAVRVDFQPDTSSLTTGNGRFGIVHGDRKEAGFYSRGAYKFDNLPHDSAYFAHQLAALRNYYAKVSRGSLTLDYSVHPAGSGEVGYTVPQQMTWYSPGKKRKKENINEYWNRKTHGLMVFIKDALEAVNKASDSPFRNLHRDNDGILRDIVTNRKAVILILHAGASYMTDGGLGGDPDSPSDMIDAFINRDLFKAYSDTLKLDAAGITVTGNQGLQLVIDEVMMSSETSNQDGLNWGIQGLLVNQMARQLGIPDLFSTSAGVSAIGAFCIMDFAGYSAGQGFIPTYPSAWVRAFMGWDKPRVAEGRGGYRVKALTSVLERGNFSSVNDDDTTILLIPINNHEYYLIENRQRNLSGDRSLFGYDDEGAGIISAYPFNVNVEAGAKKMSASSSVILETKNNDISLPASGILVWHVDERVIRQRLPYNYVNSDEKYRGVKLVEADGVNDLGAVFSDVFYQAVFDYGGAEDVFPHRTTRDGKTTADVRGFGPYSRPSTRSNDGGHTYLSIDFNHASASPREEKSQIFQYNTVVINYSDSVFTVDVKYDYLAQGWPRRAAPDNFYDPLITGIAMSSSSSNNGNNDTVLTLLDESGRLYLYSVNKNKQDSYGNRSAGINAVDYQGKTVSTSLTVTYLDSIPGVFTFPTAIENRIYIPSTQSNQHLLNVYNSVDINDKALIALPAAPSSYVCGISGGIWAVGLRDGRIIIGTDNSITDTMKLSSQSPVNAIAVLKDEDGKFTAIQDDGSLSIIKKTENTVSMKVPNGIAPYTLVTGDLDNDGRSEIVVSDARQGVWVYTRELHLAQGWKEKPNDWANAYHVDPEKRRGVRERYPKNHSAPALADINRDGHLDIVIGGTNGIYALNARGALLSKWPAYLDNRYWYQRGSITTSPIVVSADRNHPLVLFSSPTGERATFGIYKVETADKARGVVTFRRDDGTLDSLWDISAAEIDTILTLGDSLITPYILPGGFVDALTGDAARPLSRIDSWAVPQSRWPLSMGAPVTTSPLAYRASRNTVPDLFAVSSDGMVYRWNLGKLDAAMLSDSLYWPQNGFDAARTFAYGGARIDEREYVRVKEPIIFWNYPNPTSRSEPQTTFKYQFSGKASGVRLDIHTITGYRMDTFKNLSGDYPDWNEFNVDLRKYGPGIYRCRMEATVNGMKYSKMWKMAVVK